VEWVQHDTSDPMTWLRDLYGRGVTSVMVEGGTVVLQQLIDAGAWDEARIEVSPRRVERGVAAPVIGGCLQRRWRIDGNEITIVSRQSNGGQSVEAR